ncbi:DNA excision repair protein ERCC-6-like, partial [Huso huso]
MYDHLYEYQKQGLAFLYSLHQSEKKGGILADDMGLGKTVQIVTFLSGMLEMDLIKSVLLVMPCSLLGNWITEFKTWTPSIRFKVFHHSERNPDKNLKDVQTIGDVLITSYETLAQNWQKFSKHDETAFTWDMVIFDEAHKIKTPSTKSFKAACLIPAHTRILLTGTPVQNNLKEMWALFNVACQETLLGTYRTFKKLYEDPISKAREKNASPHMKSLGLKMSESLTEMITPYYLRRTKEEVQKNRHDSDHRNECHPENKENHDPEVAVEMPLFTRKNDFVIWLHLSPLQEILYENLIYSDKVKECLETSRSPLSDLNTLKKICDHPRLLSAQVYRELFHLDKSGIDCWNGDKDMWCADVRQQSSETLIQESGKLPFLISLLEKLREEGNRTLVFSQSRKMLDIIENILDDRGFKVMRVDGTVSHLAQRERRITKFKKNRDYSVFLLTTQVGGLGLNLTAANRVVIFDPCWNPARDDQAVDRVYRIGQKKAVVIYRLITCGTVEEKIYRRQVFKNSLIRQATGDEKNPVRYFNNQELKELFILEDTQSSSTQIQLQKMHAAQRQTDKELDAHIAYLHSLKIFGISDHNLLFSEAQEDENETEAAQNDIRLKVEKAQGMIEAESQVVRHHGIHEADLKLSKPQKKSSKPTLNERDTGMSSPEVLGLSKGSSKMEDDSYNASEENSQLTEEAEGECLEGVALQNNSNALPEKEATKPTWNERDTGMSSPEVLGLSKRISEIEDDSYNASEENSQLTEEAEGECLQGVALPEKEATKPTWNERDTGMSSPEVLGL